MVTQLSTILDQTACQSLFITPRSITPTPRRQSTFHNQSMDYSVDNNHSQMTQQLDQQARLLILRDREYTSTGCKS